MALPFFLYGVISIEKRGMTDGRKYAKIRQNRSAD